VTTIINAHVWPGGPGSRCTVCGTARGDDTDAGSPLSCINRIESDRGSAARRIVACEDADVIRARLDELRAERDIAFGAAAGG